MTNLSSIAGFSAGGGGGAGADGGELHSGTPVATATIDRTGSDDRTTNNYTSGLIPGACPNGVIKSRNVFATWTQWYDSPNSNSGFSISSFSVDRSTGAITILQSGPQDVWTNGGAGAAISTTYCSWDPVHGCFFSAGNNGYTSGSHTFGYTAGQVATDGSVNGGQMSQSNADHQRNGTYCGGLYQGTGTNYFMTSGYDAGNSNYWSYRLHTAESTGITIGSLVAGGAWTSSGGPWNHVWQPDQSPAAGEVVCGNGGSFNHPNYGWVLARGSSVTNMNRDTGYAEADIYQGANGVPFVVQHDYSYGTFGNSSNSFTSLADGDRDFGGHIMATYNYGIRHVGIGENKFLFFRPADDAFDGLTDRCELIGLEANNNPKRLAHLSTGVTAEKSVLDAANYPQSYFVMFENDNDVYPKWLIEQYGGNGRTCEIKVYEITADFSTFTI